MSTIQEQTIVPLYEVNCIFCVGQGKRASFYGSMDTCFCCKGTGRNSLIKYDIEHRLKEMLKERHIAAHQNKSWRRWDQPLKFSDMIEVESMGQDGTLTVRLKVPLNFVMMDITLGEP